MAWYFFDIINFILLFLLMDFFNGIHNNFFGKKLKSSFLVIVFFALIDVVICIGASFFLAAKISLLVTEILIIITVFIIKHSIRKTMRYEDVEGGKEEFFGKKRIMILVPHQDDDINLMGGVLEQYVKHESDVYVVFSTNGDGDERYDMEQMGYVRMREAIKALSFLGVPESNIIFLGYGDGWDKNGSHLYNVMKDEVVLSRAGRKATYGLATHPAYHENKEYTYANYYEDIRKVILEYQPDTIFCIDYDTHNEHRVLSMTFEKVMGEIIKSTDYRPTVYKGYGYRTAMGSVADYYDSENISASVNRLCKEDIELYDWDSRIRLPVDVGSLSRYHKHSKLYKALSLYVSQRAEESADRIINGDKVFWERRTDSLLYKANVSVSSGDKDKLTDFMLLDCDNLLGHGDKPYDGVWHPDEDDEKKEICVSFDSEEYIDNIVLYDNPSPQDNILNINIILDDGTSIKTRKLSSGGTAISVKKKVNSFSVIIDEFEGSNFGLTEIEAYATVQSYASELYKIIDDQDNFVYDYIASCEELDFKVYCSSNQVIDSKDFVVKCDNKKCSAELFDGKIMVRCPIGQKCQISLFSKDNVLLDRILVRNPCKVGREFMQYCLKNNDKITLRKMIAFKACRDLLEIHQVHDKE